MQKKANPVKRICPIKNDITTFELASELKIYSRYQRSDNKKAGPFLTLPKPQSTYR
jgi:hypothetical protein